MLQQKNENENSYIPNLNIKYVSYSINHMFIMKFYLVNCYTNSILAL